jgi:hypothetical protein
LERVLLIRVTLPPLDKYIEVVWQTILTPLSFFPLLLKKSNKKLFFSLFISHQ